MTASLSRMTGRQALGAWVCAFGADISKRRWFCAPLESIISFVTSGVVVTAFAGAMLQALRGKAN